MKIALLGSAPSSCQLAPFGDPTWEIWACSPQNHKAPRLDAWFEMHSLDRKWVPGNEPYVAALQRHPRVYIAVPDARLPNGIILPGEELMKPYGGRFVGSFMQSSVSWMLALALTYKPKTIGLWGIDMAAADEYGQQRPGCHFFFNEAEKLGIEIVAPPESDILEPLPLYGYKEQYPMYWRQKARKLELKTRLADAEARRDAADREALLFTGGLQDIDYTNNTYLRPSYTDIIKP